MTKVIIIGAGTGGLSVAKELSKNKDAEVLIIEKGPLADTKDAYKYYDTWDRNEMEIIKTTLVGGSSTVIAGNFIPSFVEELKKYVEIDGEQHYTDKMIQHDKERNEYLLNLGWNGLRIRWSEYKKLSEKGKEDKIQEVKTFLFS